MSATHCPTCKEALHQFPRCGQCVNPHCDDYTEHPRLSPLPGQEDQSARLAASAEVDQVVDTPTLEQFEAFLHSRRAQNLVLLRAPSPVAERLFEEVDRCRPFVGQIKLCEAVLLLLAEFKQEQSA